MKTNSVRAAAAVAVLVLWCASCWAQKGIPANAVSSANHYRDSGLGPATGRSGNATLNARALLAKDGSTLVELTTGMLDSSTTPPGNLDKVQFKPFDQAGNAIYAQNWTGLTGGGYYSFTTTELNRLQQLQLQANASGIDKRTDVITVVETVKLRPDIAVAKVTNPSSAYVNQVVNISAVVKELNGDTGANTNCVLYANGTAIDRANAIWVDAGGIVTCAFAYQFTSQGTYNLQVSAENVVPADWDTSNNSATSSIDIVAQTQKLTGYTWFMDETGSQNDSWTGTATDATGATVYNYQQTATGNYHYQNAGAFGYSYGLLPPVAPITAHYNETADGTTVYNASGSPTWASVTTSPDGNGGTLWHEFFYGWTGSVGLTHIEYSGDLDANGNVISSWMFHDLARYAGDVTYQSNGIQCGYWWYGWDMGMFPSCTTGNYYTWNTSQKTQWGTLLPLGSSHGVFDSFVDANGLTFSGGTNISMPNASTYNWGCNENDTWSYGPDADGVSGTLGYNCNENWNEIYGSNFF